jgi:Uma2 family endonuclease
MSLSRNVDLKSVPDYLVAESAAQRKHEYVEGAVYAVARERNAHHMIASNTLGAVGSRLRGRRCRAFNSATKVRIRLKGQVRFYYPDASIVCRSNPPTDSFQDQPAAVFEVLSHGTRRIDEGEKKDAYLSIPSLHVYVLIEQETAAVVVFRRAEHSFVREVYKGLDAVVPLREVEIELPLAEVYDGVDFTPEPEDGEAG